MNRESRLIGSQNPLLSCSSCHCQNPHTRHQPSLASEPDAALGLCLLLKLDMTLRMDSMLMEEEPLPGFLGLLPLLGLSADAETWLGTAENGLAADSCLELLASRRSWTVMRTLSTACRPPGHPKCDATGCRFSGIKVQGTSCE